MYEKEREKRRERVCICVRERVCVFMRREIQREKERGGRQGEIEYSS